MKVYKPAEKNVHRKIKWFTSLHPKNSGRRTGNLTGFTLIELLVVIVVIGILTTMATILLNSARVKARDTKRISDIKQIQTALEMYNNNNNGYPDTITPGSSLVDSSGITYMKKIPSDPKISESGQEYIYTANGTTSYTLTYALVKGVGDIAAGNWGAVPGNIGIAVPPPTACQSASGGTITTSGDYTIHTFTASSTFSVGSNCQVIVLAVGGGGGGGGAVSGSSYASGGGGGQVQYTSGLSLSAQTYTVSVGDGGAGQAINNNPGIAGGNSVFSSVTALGGGGATTTYGGISGSGKSGGSISGGTVKSGGGGGGDSVVGSSGVDTNNGGSGGAGTSNSITGSPVFYGGGGGGGAFVTPGSGGSGGGGAGSTTGTATPGTANTGGGGGGSGGTTSAAGGSGIVIIKYLTP